MIVLLDAEGWIPHNRLFIHLYKTPKRDGRTDSPWGPTWVLTTVTTFMHGVESNQNLESKWESV